MSNEQDVYFLRMREDAKVPTYSHPTDCCADLYSADDVTIKPGERKLVDTGIAVEMPEGFEIQIRPRSGIAWNNGITVLNSPGTIDEPYRNSLKVILINLGDKPYTICVGDRIAQAKLSPVYKMNFIEKSSLSDTDRGLTGFGNTGK